jgi:diguanylate cyclase (GGDEF)-like protein
LYGVRRPARASASCAPISIQRGTTAEKPLRAFRETRHDVGTRRDLNVTISIGMATHNDGRQFRSVDELLKAADKALYTAKLQGRNRSVPFDLVANSQLAYM